MKTRIKPEDIPEEAVKELCMAVLDAVKKFYKDPKNRKAYEEWEAQRAKASN